MKGALIMKKLALAALIAWAGTSAFSLDLTGSGLSSSGNKTEDGKTLAVLTDQSGGQVLLDAEADLAPDRVAALGSLVAEIRSWSDFQPTEIRAVNTEGRLQVTALPRSFSIKGTALEGAIPGGIQLFYKTATEYDFKVKSGLYLVRVASVFTTWAELETAVLAAFQDPPSFIATRDPLYVQRRLGELDQREAALEQATFDPSSQPDDKGVRTSKSESDIAALRAELKAYEARSDAALLTAVNGGKPINPDAVAKLIELKKATPSLDRKGAPAAIKAAGFTLTAGEIAAIFLVEFGER